MFFFHIFLSLILTFNRLESLFVTIGDYRPDLGVNDPLCGQNVVQKEYEFLLQYMMERCFATKFPNQTYDQFYPKEENVEQYVDTRSQVKWDPISKRVKSRVLYGDYAEQGEAPWAVYLNSVRSTETHQDFIPEGSNNCSGSLITFNWVLTAAHCIKMDRTTFVYAGNVSKGHGAQRLAVKKIIHPDFGHDMNSSFEFGLIKLNEPFERTTDDDHHYTINTVCLPKKKQGGNEGNEDFEMVRLYGYGRFNGSKSDQMGRADIQLYPYQYCSAYPYLLCVYFGSEDYTPRGCVGDSGGGLVQRVPGRQASVIVGILATSDGPPNHSNCIPPNLGINQKYSNVARMIDWILENITND